MAWRSCVLSVLVCCVTVAAAGEQAPGQENREGRRRRGQFDRSRMQQMMLERLKENLEASDDEWTALKPRLETVMTLSRQTTGGGGMRSLFRRDRRPGPEPAPAQPERQVSDAEKKAEELTKILENKEAKPEEIKAKLTALREAREKAKDELAKARASLRELLTQRQEAKLVLFGILD